MREKERERDREGEREREKKREVCGCFPLLSLVWRHKSDPLNTGSKSKLGPCMARSFYVVKSTV